MQRFINDPDMVVEDTVREVSITETGTVFLNFGAAYPDEVLTVVVMKDTRPRFPGVETWKGKKVHIEGVVSDRQFFARSDLDLGRIRFKPDSLAEAAWGSGFLYDPLELIVR